MRQEIFKIHYEEYFATKYKESSPIDYHEPVVVCDDVCWEGVSTDNRPREISKKRPLFIVDKSINFDEKIYIENYGNRLYDVMKTYMMVVIERDGDKISLKLFTGFKKRSKGVSYFRIKKNLDYITVNIKTGDVYTGFLRDFQKKRKSIKQVRRNTFINEPLNSMKLRIRNHLREFTLPDTIVSSEIIHTAIDTFITSIDEGHYKDLSNDDRLFKFYLDKRGIKYPNNFGVYRNHLIGPEIRKKLKKNNGKLVDAFMGSKDLKGSVLKKSLHECHQINLNVYNYAKKVFGDDRLNNDNGVITQLLNTESTANCPQYSDVLLNLFNSTELNKYYSCFKETYIKNNMDTYTLSDHVRTYYELREYGVDIKWMSDGIDRNVFHQEHMDWADKLSHYRNGSYTLIYPDVLHKLLSNKINGVSPILLTTSQEYNEESTIQSNCVKGYITRPTSIIISLRNDIGDRATIEYSFKLVNDNTTLSRVQSLGKRNQKLEEEWNDVLFKLDEIMLSYVKDKNFEFVKVIKENQMGMTMNSNSVWDNYGFLTWEDKKITQINSFIW